MKQNLWALAYLHLLLLTFVTLLLACDEIDVKCVNGVCTKKDAGAHTTHPTRDEKNTNENAADASRNTTGIQLACVNEPRPEVNHLTLTNTSTIQPLPLAIWEQHTGACNAFQIRRENGYEYHLTLIPVGLQRSMSMWIATSTLGNNAPPLEIINLSEGNQAYVYTATDYGIPKVYALYIQPGTVVYIEWIYEPTTDPQQRLRNLNENHLTLEIPNDLRELLTQLH